VPIVTPTAAAPQLILASGSPRRRELLHQIGVAHVVQAADVDERQLRGEDPATCAARLAVVKARAVHGAAHGRPQLPVLGADTLVVQDGVTLGKPRGRADALAMLQQLSGRTHRVISAVALVTAAGVASRLSDSEVLFRRLTPAECAAYWDTGEPRDKAGAYAIQGLGAVFIAALNGSFSAMGRRCSRPRSCSPQPAAAGAINHDARSHNVNPREMRAAVVENGATLDCSSSASRSGIVGNSEGRVSRVLPGMHIFIDIGPRTAPARRRHRSRRRRGRRPPLRHPAGARATTSGA
jgi:septum formation protein